MTWRPLPAADRLGPGEVAGDEVDGVVLVVWRATSGRICAFDGRCPHQWSPLAQEGFVDGEELVCRAHGWRFDVDGHGWKDNVLGRRDGKAPVTAYTVIERTGTLGIDIP